MELVVRAVKPRDAEQIVAILNPIIAAGAHTVFDRPFSVQAEREYIERFPERGVFLAAVEPAFRTSCVIGGSGPKSGFPWAGLLQPGRRATSSGRASSVDR